MKREIRLLHKRVWTVVERVIKVNLSEQFPVVAFFADADCAIVLTMALKLDYLQQISYIQTGLFLFVTVLALVIAECQA